MHLKAGVILEEVYPGGGVVLLQVSEQGGTGDAGNGTPSGQPHRLLSNCCRRFLCVPELRIRRGQQFTLGCVWEELLPMQLCDPPLSDDDTLGEHLDTNQVYVAIRRQAKT